VLQGHGQVATVSEHLVDLVPEQQQALHDYFFFSAGWSDSKESFIRSDQFL
jgi:hypothetical protein